MRIDRRLVLIGVMLIVLSMTMATQYATTKTGYSFALVHPSNADIRFIASDNSTDQIFLLRTDGDNSSDTVNSLVLNFGNISANQNVTYTAAFGIVNEEAFTVNITHINVTADSGSDYLQIWVKGDRDAKAEDDPQALLIWDRGTNPGNFNVSTTIWQLGAGNNDPTDLDGSTGYTLWNDRAGIQYSYYDSDATNTSDDYCWFQISITPDDSADTSATYAGTVMIHTKAHTN